MSKKRRAEQKFCCELRSGALSAGEVWHKIPDCAGPGTQKRPFDAFFTSGNISVALEAKHWYTDRSSKTFWLPEFKEHQLTALTEIDAKPNWVGAGAIRWNSPRDRKPRAVVIGIRDLLELMEVQNSVTEAQLLGEELCEHGKIPFVELWRVKNSGIAWNIEYPVVWDFNYWELLHENKAIKHGVD